MVPTLPAGMRARRRPQLPAHCVNRGPQRGELHGLKPPVLKARGRNCNKEITGLRARAQATPTACTLRRSWRTRGRATRSSCPTTTASTPCCPCAPCATSTCAPQPYLHLSSPCAIYDPSRRAAALSVCGAAVTHCSVLAIPICACLRPREVSSVPCIAAVDRQTPKLCCGPWRCD